MGDTYTFHKDEKLSHKVTIDAIFQKKGASIFKSPVLFAFLKKDLQSPYPCQLLVSVGKRKFKKAVDRNRIKRQITEIYRKQKHRMYAQIPNGTQYAIGILFLGKEMPDYALLENKLTAAIDEFIKKV